MTTKKQSFKHREKISGQVVHTVNGYYLIPAIKGTCYCTLLNLANRHQICSEVL